MVRFFRQEAGLAVILATVLGLMAVLALCIRERPTAEALGWALLLSDGAAWGWAIREVRLWHEARTATSRLRGGW